MKISFKRFLRIHIPVLAAVVIYLLLPIKCPIKYFLHFDCPTCGMTRAMFSLLRGDFSSYLRFNPMAIPFLLLLLFALHRKVFPINRKISDGIIIAGALCVTVAYILRIIFI